MSLPESQSWKKIRLNSGKAVNAGSKDTDQVDRATIDKDEQIDSSENAELNEQVISNWKVREQDVGLTEYVDASIPGFSAVIKQRYSDFLVYEIDQDNNIVHITNTDLPKDINVDKQSSKTLNDDITVISTDQIFLDMKSLLGDEITEKVKTLLNTEGQDLSFVDTKPEKEKDKRTIIHQFFKKHFGDKLNTETKEDQQQARQHWAENHDAKKALELFPKRCVAECNILSSFVKTGHNKDCAGAFASVVGDLVILDDNELGDNIADSDVTINSEDKKEIKVKILKEEDIPNYTIYDVVLPLPGYLVVYPNNNIFEKYKELMWKDHLDPREMKRNI
ncbi:1134_t:CDS:2, partial [Racocetra fulgida]